MDRPVVNERGAAALRALALDYPVVAVKFAADEPAGMRRLDKRIALCAMLKEAQDDAPFYATMDEQGCAPGSYVLGHIDHDPMMESGRIGPAIGVFETAEANQAIYTNMTRFPAGSFPYTLFSRLDDLQFEPDLLIVTATPSQAEVITRAHGYRTGAAWETRGTTVLGCACLYAHPFLNGKMNILISGLHHGMRARQLFPQGLLFIAIPRPLLEDVLESLALMVEKGLVDLPQYHWGREAHESRMREIMETLRQELDSASPTRP